MHCRHAPLGGGGHGGGSGHGGGDGHGGGSGHGGGGGGGGYGGRGGGSAHHNHVAEPRLVSGASPTWRKPRLV